jgi:hypothetical protein
MKAGDMIMGEYQLPVTYPRFPAVRTPRLTQRPGNESQHGDLREVGEDEHGSQDSDRGEDGSKDDGEERLHQVWVCKASE